MARGKVQLKRIENPVHRQVTFCKRRAGLLKKARELSTLCDADIGVIIFSTHGKLYDLSTNGTMQELIERYMKSSHGAQTEQPENVNHPPALGRSGQGSGCHMVTTRVPFSPGLK
ncbi:hypothetical protein AMTR_s00071p00198970 [Amborella trichopoda]|uniref:MADS-box domain-containing protein n=1 Tax=Amborella trichopoda TaxID=13333 RepID=U5DC39_AMBTC|nr:hypothetical protein AMTR_s00071p00198970 [Amborella trichopoda]